MDPVFSSQFQAMHDAFAREGTDIEIAYTSTGEASYIYQAGRLLARRDVVREIQELLPGTVPVQEEPGTESLVVLSIERLTDGFRTVPQALDFLDERLDGERIKSENEALDDGFPLVSPVHVLHISQGAGSNTAGRICPATEPEVPCGCGPDELCGPCPPLLPDGGAGVFVGICDTGLLADIAATPWLAGVTGELDPLGPLLPDGLYDIPRYHGHGTFIAGVTRCEAPGTEIYVANHFAASGGVLETVMRIKLEQMLTLSPRPQLVNLSGGGYTRHDWQPLAFTAFDLRGVTLTAAAGNDATDRKFWPAAFDWAVGVGALGADQRHLAWFTNYGDWVNVYALGEGLINAFAIGEYSYQEPPKRPHKQVFHGRARWSGTSFSAPLVAGLIAARLSALSAADPAATAWDAWTQLRAQAAAQAIPGVGPVLYPR